LADLEQLPDHFLDEPMDADRMEFSDLLNHNPYRAGKLLLDEIPAKMHQELGLFLVEGEHPGSSLHGGVEQLNLALQATRLTS